MSKREYRGEILQILNGAPYRALKAKELARRLRIDQQHYHELRAELRDMVHDGEIFKYPRNRYGRGRGIQEIEGILYVKTQGYGFVVREGGEDVFVSQRNMGLAFHKDRVRVQLFAQTRGKSPEGKILQVIERVRRNIVGTYRRGRRHGFVVPDELKIQRDIYIDDTESGGARSGQKVVVTIDGWQDERSNPEGRIIEVLGYPGQQGVDVLSVARSFDLVETFPLETLHQTELIPDEIPPAELASRLDLRDFTAFTIDPEDAKDFDDAVSLDIGDDGTLRLGVHIADVSYFVREGSAVDEEARKRGTSVYLVDRVIPMLPERLSTQLCSLQEGVDRLTYSVLMDLSPSGDLLRYEFHPSLIRSTCRFDYTTVAKILERKYASPYASILQHMLQLSKALIRKRQRRGSIDLDAPEVTVILDSSGRPAEIRRRQRLDSHRLIEEFMLLANETVAQHIGSVLKEQLELDEAWPFVYRIHEKPNKEKLEEFLHYIAAFGIEVEPPKRFTPHFFQRLISRVEGLDAEFILRDALLRAMQKARYSTENVGHFGLSYKYYTHFTSPIRRYPDLMVHRLLKRYTQPVAGRKMGIPPRTTLEEHCTLASQREVVAQEAERESVKMKQVEYMADHVGERFAGVVSRVVPFGVFVELTDLLVEGLIHVTDLGRDYYLYDEQCYAMIGQHHGRTYRVGDKLTVQVAKVDTNQRIVDFLLA